MQGEWLKRELKRAGLSQRALARHMKIDPSSLSRLINGERHLKASEARAIADFLHRSIGDVMQGFGDSCQPESVTRPRYLDILPSASPERIASIPEIDVRGGMGPGGEALVDYRPDRKGGLIPSDAVVGRWDLPEDYLRNVVRVYGPSAAIIAVVGDSMAPTLEAGDRIMVNLADRHPSPPGIFALWDGLGVVVKRIEHIPNSEPARLRIASDNTKHQAYERNIDEVSIIGRVVWFARMI